MKHMIQPFGIDMHKNVLTDTKAVKHMHFYEADKTDSKRDINHTRCSFCGQVNSHILRVLRGDLRLEA